MKKFFSFVAALFFTGSMMAADPVTLTFKDWGDTSLNKDNKPANTVGDYGTAYTTDNLVDSIENGAGFVTCTETAKAYAGRVNMGVKLGSSSAIGSFTLALVNPAEFDSIVVRAASYSATEGSISICGGTAIDLTNGGADNKVLKDYVVVPNGVVSTFSVATTVKRAYVKSITFYPAATSPSTSTNLFDASTTTFESWFGDGGWAPITTSTASWDSINGTISCTLNQQPFGQWHAQLKLHTTGIVLDPAKNYEFKATFTSTMAAGGITAKLFDNSELSIKSDIAVEANVPYDYTSAAFAGGEVGNGVIAFDLGNCPNGAVVTISNIVLQESQQEVVEDPKPTSAPAAPTADAATVLSVYSDTYPAAATFGFNEAWGQTTALQELDFDGNHVLYYKNFNWLGWATATPIDASTCTGLHLDIWAAAAGSIRVVPIYGGTGLTTDDSHGKVVTLAEGWNSIDLNLATDFAGLNLESIHQFKFDQNVGGNIFAFDNVYFTGYTAPAVVYTSLADTYAKANNDVVTLKDFEVVYVNGAYCYIKDVTASALIYKSGYGLVAGDKVAKGLEAKISIYNNLYELVPNTAKADLTVTPGTPAQPTNATAAPTAADNKYMAYKNVTFLADSLGNTTTADRTVLGVFGNDTITFYNTFKNPVVHFEAGKTYDVVGFNTCFKTTIQVAVASIEEHQGIVDECAGEHGLYDAAAATINSTYLAPGWNVGAGADHYATIENGVIVLHVGAQGYADMWNGQVFVDPGFTFTPGKAYHYEFDIVSSAKVCITVKVNDSDPDAFFAQSLYDLNIGGGTYHFSTDSVFANERLAASGKGPLVFGFGWTDPNQDIFIKCIKITEVGDAPAPVEEHMYIKHPWGTGVDADWSWQEMNACTFKNVDAWTYIGAWGGVGFNIADNAEGNNASWYAAADIQFLDDEQALVEAPAVGTANCEFYFIPSFVGGIVTPAYVVVPVTEGVENVMDFKASKAVVDGKLVIVKNGVVYNIVGARF